MADGIEAGHVHILDIGNIAGNTTDASHTLADLSPSIDYYLDVQSIWTVKKTLMTGE